jgi:hypothetical protein
MIIEKDKYSQHTKMKPINNNITNNKNNSTPMNKIVGQFYLGKTLGKGTFGKVKLGTHISTGEKVSKISHIYIIQFFNLGSNQNFRKSKNPRRI